MGKEKLTMEEVNEQLNIADLILTQFSSGYSQAMRTYTPEMVNQVMQSIS